MCSPGADETSVIEAKNYNYPIMNYPFIDRANRKLTHSISWPSPAVLLGWPVWRPIAYCCENWHAETRGSKVYANAMMLPGANMSACFESFGSVLSHAGLPGKDPINPVGT